ncbi:hypothetical protein GCM10009853_026750 [Glycomyces scopariae]
MNNRISVEQAFDCLPEGLKIDLVGSFNKIAKNYREGNWEPSELNGGKLCEAVYTVVEGYLKGGIYPDRSAGPPNLVRACRDLEQKYPKSDSNFSLRILIPRVLLSLYAIRNNRGVGHGGAEVDPNQMDATVVLHLSKWLMSELVRILHTCSTEDAQIIVDNLVQREIPIVWSSELLKRVLNVKLSQKQQTLVLLLTDHANLSESDLVKWIECRSVSNYRRDVLRPLHRSRMIEYDEKNRTVMLLPPGIQEAEDLVLNFRIIV